MFQNRSLQLVICVLAVLLATATTTLASKTSQWPPTYSIRLPGDTYSTDWDEDYISRNEGSSPRRSWAVGAGREFSIYDSRGGSSADTEEEEEFMERYRRLRQNSNLYGNMYTNPAGRVSKFKPKFLQKAQDWWSSSVRPNFKSWPQIVARVEPTTTLKLRKTFRPLKTIVRLGADFNTQLGVWQFKSSWEDAIIGGKLTLIGKELQLTKSWQLSVGKENPYPISLLQTIKHRLFCPYTLSISNTPVFFLSQQARWRTWLRG